MNPAHVEKNSNRQKDSTERSLDTCSGQSLCREITGIHTYMQTSWVFKYNPISFAWKYWLKQNPSKHLKD